MLHRRNQISNSHFLQHGITLTVNKPEARCRRVRISSDVNLLRHRNDVNARTEIPCSMGINFQVSRCVNFHLYSLKTRVERSAPPSMHSGRLTHPQRFRSNK
ncbi:hypothetical protein Zmor_015153 [Zophobas morio]|uniref:Uncharacterized protein n=1 Tax=Zophobas morio TaxID=2755281 RepID=A0AA38IHJ8_9CUCU|nr:hypothetical protein Zmor_015153 [Zophobas morio]